MGTVEDLRQQNQLESELLLQQNLVKTLQNNIEALKFEVKKSREDVVNAEKVVDYLMTQITYQENVQKQEEKLFQLETQLREEQMRSNSLEFEKNKLNKRAHEMDRQNTMLIAQFSEQFMPCYYNETATEDELRDKFKDIQQIIQSNIELQQKVEELESNVNNDLPVLGGDHVKFELEKTKTELEKTKINFDHANAQIKRLQTFVDYYKAKYEEFGDDTGRSEIILERMETGDSSNALRGKFEYDAELSKLRSEVSSAFTRLDELTTEKQSREKTYEDLITQKNELVAQLLASKETLEFKVQSQEEMIKEMDKRLNDLDKTNRTLDGQRIKTVTEHDAMKSNLEALQQRFNNIEAENREFSLSNRELNAELESTRTELAELRVKCESFADNESVSTSISSTLNEFREAYLKLDGAQLVQAKEQLESLRKDNETLANFVKAMNVQQMFAMDKMKTTLSDAQLQREAYFQECTTLRQKLNTLQLEHDDLTEKHNVLAQQLVDIDTSDATLESCRKQIQQLRNKISYLEKTVQETNARAEKWNVQLAVSEKQCKTFKEIAETLEKNLQENEEKSSRENNRIQELCDIANNQNREGQTIIEDLRAQISELQGQFSSREAELEQNINEWKSQVTEMEKEKLELGAQLDRLEGELLAARNHGQELESQLSQKQIEIDDLTETRNALDDACNEKIQEVDECRAEIQNLTEKLANSDTVIAEIRQGLQAEIDSLQQKVAIFEKAQLDDQGNRQSVFDSVSEMLSRIANDTDQLPMNLSIPEMSNSAEMSKALEIIDRMQREKKEETNRRLQLIAEQQSAIPTPAENVVPMQEFNAVVTKLRNQIEAQSAEIQQKMEQISELQLLEGTRERCELLEAELLAARNELDQTKQALASQQAATNQFTFKAQKYEQLIKDMNAKQEKVRELARRYKTEADRANKLLEQYANKSEQAADESIEIVQEEAAPSTSDVQPTSTTTSEIKSISFTVETTASEVPQTSTSQAPVVVSTSGAQIMTAEQRAGRFRADVLSKILQDDTAAPPSLKRKREEE